MIYIKTSKYSVGKLVSNKIYKAYIPYESYFHKMFISSLNEICPTSGKPFAITDKNVS